MKLLNFDIVRLYNFEINRMTVYEALVGINCMVCCFDASIGSAPHPPCYSFEISRFRDFGYKELER